ncbi:MAG: hypothetical protein IT460_02030 [Planctomycetes bacterium]|nr:hypothetical protein [Planctomycetota bacterium]
MDAKSLSLALASIAMAVGAVVTAAVRRPTQVGTDVHRDSGSEVERDSAAPDLVSGGWATTRLETQPRTSPLAPAEADSSPVTPETLRETMLRAIRSVDWTELARLDGLLHDQVELVAATVLPVILSTNHDEDVRLAALYLMRSVSPSPRADWATPVVNACLQSDSSRLRYQGLDLAVRCTAVALEPASVDALRTISRGASSEVCVLACRVLRRLRALPDAEYALVLEDALRVDGKSTWRALDAAYFDPPTTALGRGLCASFARCIADQRECVVGIAWREDASVSFILRTCDAALVVASRLGLAAREDVARLVRDSLPSQDDPEWAAAVRLCLDAFPATEDAERLLRSERPAFRWIGFLVRLRGSGSVEDARVLVDRMGGDRFDATKETVEQWRSEHPKPK